jgi:hypothetical protein
MGFAVVMIAHRIWWHEPSAGLEPKAWAAEPTRLPPSPRVP